MALGHGRWTRDARSRLFVPETAGSTPGFNPANYGANYGWWAARLESFTDGALVSTATNWGNSFVNMTAASGQEPTYKAGTDPNSANGYFGFLPENAFALRDLLQLSTRSLLRSLSGLREQPHPEH